MNNENINNFLSKLENALLKMTNEYYIDDSKVKKAVQYSLLNAGKRTRAVLVYLLSEMLNIDLEKILPIAMSIEMVHCYSLIHDDLPCMDDDDIRRGKPACHIAFGEDTALLAGDSLISVSAQLILDNNIYTDKEKCELINTLYQTIGPKGMIYGQELDLEFENTEIDKETLNKIHENKTGKLILFCALCIFKIHNLTIKEKENITIFFKNIGLVFQIVDDILDVEKTTQELGKPANSDVSNNKSTFITIYGLNKAKEIANELTQNAISSLNNSFGQNSDSLVKYTQYLLNREK